MVLLYQLIRGFLLCTNLLTNQTTINETILRFSTKTRYYLTHILRAQASGHLIIESASGSLRLVWLTVSANQEQVNATHKPQGTGVGAISISGSSDLKELWHGRQRALDPGSESMGSYFTFSSNSLWWNFWTYKKKCFTLKTHIPISLIISILCYFL